MTNRELIEKRIPYPMSEMVIKYCIPTGNGQWLDTSNNETAYDAMITGFSWSETSEGFDFWHSLYNKLRAKNL
jgi:hypothetical protein